MPIFDQGYQHWSGKLSGHAWRWLAITRHGVRLGMQNWLLRIFLLFAWLPAVALTGLLCIWGLLERKSSLTETLAEILSFLDPEMLKDPRAYRVEVWTLAFDYFLRTELFFSMVLVLMVGPSLISQDLRVNALPLYFSRPLRRIDYFIGKLGVIGFFLGMVLIVPCLIAYILGLLFSLDITILWDTLPLLFSAIAYGLVMIVSIGLLILALSSLSRNSRFVGLFWLGVWIVSSVTATTLQGVNEGQRRQREVAEMNRRMAEQRQSAAPQSGVPPAQGINGQMTAQQQSWEKLEEEYGAEQLRQSKSDWRPMVSYTANLARLGRVFLGTDACWIKLSENRPPEQRNQYLASVLGPQYPWYWSAGVLAALWGISAWILNRRVRSLDRLR